MKKFSFLLVLSLFFVASCATPAPPPTRVQNTAPPAAVDEHGHEDNAERISLAEAKSEYDAGKAVMVDVRDSAAYEAEHVKGALNITPATLDAKLNEIPKGKKIIVYCS